MATSTGLEPTSPGLFAHVKQEAAQPRKIVAILFLEITAPHHPPHRMNGNLLVLAFYSAPRR